MHKLARRREKLWLEDPRCRFCQIVTLLKSDKGVSQPEKDRLATIEHLESRYNPLRGKVGGGDKGPRTTLACWRCNNDRNKVEQESIPIEIRRERSKH